MGCGSSSTGVEPGSNTPGKKKKKGASQEDEGYFEPFTDFPTPTLLFNAQREYHKVCTKAEVGQDAYGIPLPFLPSDTSKEVLNLQQFSDIDQHAAALTALEYSEKDYERLAKHLCQPSSSELQKIRAFFVYIASQTPPKVFAYLGNRDPPEHSPLWAILTILTKKLPGLYNEILHQLCKAANIPCIMEAALVKGVSYRVGWPVQRFGNKICIVYVDGSWRMIDQHWGSQSVSAQTDPHWLLVQKGGAKVPKPGPEQIYYSVNENWFLVDPVVAVYSHLCDTPNHQLLARPVTTEEFDEIAYLHNGFFKLELSDISHPKCKITTSNGRLSISLKWDKLKPFKFYHNLYKWILDPKVDRFKGYKEKDFSVKYITGDEITIYMEFPWIGKYKLHVEGEEVGKTGRMEVCTYLIENEKPFFPASPHPHMPDGASELGVTGPVRLMGLLPVSDGQNGIVSAPNGKAVLKFTIPDKMDRRLMSLRARMDGGHIIRQYSDTEGNITFVAKITKYGKHVLTIDAGKEGERETFRYIIDAKEEVLDFVSPSDYPASLGDNGQIGFLCHESNEKLFPLSHSIPLIEAPQSGRMCVEMSPEPKDLSVSAALFSLCKKHKTPVPLPEYIFTEQEGTSIRFFLRFPNPGMYSLNLVSAKTGVPLYQYVITVHEPDLYAVPFPALGSHWPYGCKVIQPLRGTLEEEEPIDFELYLPSANNIIVKGSNGFNTQLQKNPEGNWFGTVAISKGVAEVGVYADIEEKKDRWILSYQVANSIEIKDKEKETKKNFKDVENYQKMLLERRDVIKKNTEKRNADEDSRIQKAEGDFTKNRAKYEARERELEAMKLKEENSKQNAINYSDMDLVKEMGDKTMKDKIHNMRKNVQEEAEWRSKYDQTVAKLAIDKLKQAMAEKDVHKLQEALVDCDKLKLQDSHIECAKEMLYVEKARQDFKKITKTRIIVDIQKIIEHVEADPRLKYPLKNEVEKALSMIEKLERRNRNDCHILEMDTATITEIRRYRDPPDPVHRVIQAALLLLGEDEQTTCTWRDVQRIFNTTGKNGLYRRVLQFNRDDVHPEIAARARELVDDIELDMLKTQSAGAAVFYEWIQGVLVDMIIDEEDHEPADIQRQRELLGRIEEEQNSVLLGRYHKAYHTYFGNRSLRAQPPLGIVSPRARGFPWGLDLPIVSQGKPSSRMSRSGSVSAQGVCISFEGRAGTASLRFNQTRESSKK